MAPSNSSSSAHTSPFPATPYQPKYDKWPYSAADFQRYDENDDNVFYRQPRFVTHIDDPAISRLTRYYDSTLPRTGMILDLCTSWKSFYPASVEEAVQAEKLKVYGIGLNAEEMKANRIFKNERSWSILDMNKEPYDVRSPWKAENVKFDATTCVVSIDYLIRPLEVCRSIFQATNEGGLVHLIISNRCFPNKVIGRWMMLSEHARLELVGGK